MEPIIACEKMMRLLNELEAVTNKANVTSSVANVVSDAHKWTKPGAGRFKLNSDAAVMKERKVGLGVVVRDHEGDVMLIAGRRGKETSIVAQAEAKALLFGLQRAFECGLRELEVESDCLHLVDLLQNKAKELTSTQIIANDIKCFTCKLEFCSFGFCRRSCNSVAHLIAKSSLYFEEELLWLEDYPPDILPLVIADKVDVSSS